MKILMAVDGSEHTKRMLAYVAAHDDLLGGGHEYTFLTVVVPIPPGATHFLDRKTVQDYYDEQAEQVFKPIRTFAQQQGWTLRTEHATGHAAETIAALAEKGKFDLIVMGSHGHGALGNVIMGSVASGMLARSRTPVLLVQ